MIKKIEGVFNAKNKNFVLVVSRFNEFISSKLVDGALDCLIRHDADEKKLCIATGERVAEIASKLAVAGS